jgi:putative oxidoreductase
MTRAQLFSTASKPDAGLALLRAVLGVTFVAHGAQKLFVFGVSGVAASFAQMGAPLPDITAPLVIFGELLGGAALAFGLLTRVAGVGLATIMASALFMVHLQNGFFMPGGIEFVLALGAGALALAMTGAGEYSMDAMLLSRKPRP